MTWLGPALVALPALAYFALVLFASVDVPYLDDFDATLGFLHRWNDTPGLAGKLSLLFVQHNEHLVVTGRVSVLATYLTLGYASFTALNGIGNLGLALLAAALFAAFHREEARQRWLAFAPAALFLFQPQHWTTLLWAVTALASLHALGFAALACAAAERRSARAAALAWTAAITATLSQANGMLALPLVALVPLLCRRPREALAWAGIAVLLGMGFFAIWEPTRGGPSALAALAHPLRFTGYALNLAGSAGAFGTRGLALGVGAALAAGFAALTALRAWRSSPALYAFALFLWGSILANALLRSHQGMGAALVQPRYTIYGAALLAVTYLLWAARPMPPRVSRAFFAVSLVLALAFSSLSYREHAGSVVSLGQQLEAGLDRWYRTGSSGLTHPHFQKASHFVHASLADGTLRVPARWLDRFGASPVETPLPTPDSSVSFQLAALRLERGYLLAMGRAHFGATARGQSVWLVLRNPRRTYTFPALTVVPSTPLEADEPLAQRFLLAGFRTLVRTAELMPGRYRVGLLVRRGNAEHLTFRRRSVTIPGAIPVQGTKTP